MGRLTDTKVRGFMVTETNNDACAQLQLCLHTLVPCAHASLRCGPASNPLVALYPKLVHFYRFHKARKREVLPSDLCLNQLQIPLTLALKRGLRQPQPAKRRRRSPFSAPKWGAAAAACSQTARSQAATLAARPDIPDAEGDGESPFISVAGEKYHWKDGEVHRLLNFKSLTRQGGE